MGLIAKLAELITNRSHQQPRLMGTSVNTIVMSNSLLQRILINFISLHQHRTGTSPLQSDIIYTQTFVIYTVKCNEAANLQRF